MSMETRRFFTISGQPEASWQKQKRLIKEQAFQLDRETKFGKDFEAEALLEQIDFKVLQDIMRQHLNRMGIASDQINFTTRDRIHCHTMYGNNIQGKYWPEYNYIEMNYPAIRSEFKGDQKESHGALGFLLTLIHEEIHATSQNDCYAYDDAVTDSDAELKFSSQLKVQSGYQVAETDPTGSEHSVFFVLDEGVTQKFALDIFQEYVRATATATPQQVEDFLQQDALIDTKVSMIDRLVALISQASGVTEVVTWQALLRSKYEGETFTDPEFCQALSDIFFEGFVEQLKLLGSHPITLDEFIKQMESNFLKNQSQAAKGQVSLATRAWRRFTQLLGIQSDATVPK